MSHLGLMSPWAKGDSWAPHAGWLASESPGISPPQPPPCRPGRPQCFAKIPIPHPAMGKTSLQGPAEVKAWRQLAGRQSGFPSSPGPVLLPGRGGADRGETQLRGSRKGGRPFQARPLQEDRRAPQFTSVGGTGSFSPWGWEGYTAPTGLSTPTEAAPTLEKACSADLYL